MDDFGGIDSFDSSSSFDTNSLGGNDWSSPTSLAGAMSGAAPVSIFSKSECCTGNSLNESSLFATEDEEKSPSFYDTEINIPTLLIFGAFVFAIALFITNMYL